jgi:hypothetical protein
MTETIFMKTARRRWVIASLLVFMFGNASLFAGDLRVTTENGVTTIVFNGRQVFMGSTTGPVTAKSATSNGVELAAAYDNGRVIWENVPGAGRYLQAAGNGR